MKPIALLLLLVPLAQAQQPWLDKHNDGVRKKIAANPPIRTALDGRTLIKTLGELRHAELVPPLDEGDCGCTAGALTRVMGYFARRVTDNSFAAQAEFERCVREIFGGRITHSRAEKNPTPEKEAYKGNDQNIDGLAERFNAFKTAYGKRTGLDWPRRLKATISLRPGTRPVGGSANWVPFYESWARAANRGQALVFHLRFIEIPGAPPRQEGAEAHVCLLYKVLEFDDDGQVADVANEDKRPRRYALMFLDDFSQGDRLPSNYARGPYIFDNHGQCLSRRDLRIEGVLGVKLLGAED